MSTPLHSAATLLAALCALAAPAIAGPKPIPAAPKAAPALDLSGPIVTKTSWVHGAPAPFGAAGLRLDVTLSQPVHPSLLAAGKAAASGAMQVWVTSELAAGAGAPSLSSLSSVPGSLAYSSGGTMLSWTPTPAALQALQALSARSRAGSLQLFIRIHCFSAAPDALLGVATPHLPGGVLESWLFLRAGG
jgi:hypothetical protein